VPSVPGIDRGARGERIARGRGVAVLVRLAMAQHSHATCQKRDCHGAQKTHAESPVESYTASNSSARFTSVIACVTLIPRGQQSVQLNTVRQRQAPELSLSSESRSAAARSRESKMKRCAATIACGPTYRLSPMNTGRR
jgi:hypothetical protein